MNPHVEMLVIPDPGGSLLLTDLYQLTMLQSYLEHGMTETAVFEFFVRKLPAPRGFLVAAGLEQAVEFLEQARFDPGCVKTIFGRSRRAIHPLTEFLQSIKSMS
jgi:nicotinic acid phosphoribosyltransferase